MSVCKCFSLPSSVPLKILTNFAKTDINLKSDGGTTPLMDAVKATNSYMVQELIKKNADISIADYEGMPKFLDVYSLVYIPSPFSLPPGRSYCRPLGSHGEQYGGLQAADPPRSRHH